MPPQAPVPVPVPPTEGVTVPVPPAEGVPVPPTPAVVTPPDTHQLDLVFVMDATGSMGSYIQSAKQNIEAIVTRLCSAEGYDLRFGLVAYRDHPPQDETFVSKSFPFCTELPLMQANLRTLSAQGGGDGPEAVEAGLLSALELDWRERATKVVVLIADAPPHGLGEAGDGFPDGAPTGVDPLQVLDRMSTRGISVYSVGCQPALSRYSFATDFMIAAAERTNGQAVALGSAAALAEVILGASIEEVELENLSRQIEAEVRDLQLAQPGLDEEEVQTVVWRGLQSKGVKTPQMRHTSLRSTTSEHVSKASTLLEARSSLAKAVPASAPPGGSSVRRKSLAAAEPLERFRAVSRGSERCLRRSSSSAGCASDLGCLAPAAATASSYSVETVEEDVSYEQVSRMFGKAKKCGRW